MRQKRTERNAANYAQQAAEALRSCTYGGNKYGSPAGLAGRKLPIVTSTRGIKMEWDRRTDEYPSTVALRMTDGAWVRYRIEVEQPEYKTPAKDQKSPGLVRGYPAEGKA